MKLTKEIIRLFKYHGFMTVTAPDEDILKRYQTVEDLTNAGFVNDPEALRMVKMVFVEDGTPAVGPTKDEDVVETPAETVTTTTEEPVDPEPENENPTTEEPAEPETPAEEPAPETVAEPEPENAPEFDGAGFTEADNEPVTESGPTSEPTADPDPEKVEEKVETETTTTEESEKEAEPTSEPEPEPESEAPAPKPKKTTTKKSTKKES